MAGTDQGRREVVNDPLAITGREQAPERSLAIQGIRPPNVGDPIGAASKQASALSSAMDGLTNALTNVIDKRRDDLIVEGKIARLTGVTEEEMARNGNRYTQEGYNSLAARDKVNSWFTNESVALAEAGRTMQPEQYQQFLSEKRKAVLDSITDPNARKVAVAAFEELSPRLAQSQVVKHSEYQKEQRISKFSGMLGGVAQTSPTRSVTDPDGNIRLTPAPIAATINSSAEDRDVGIRTILGEAANQGTDGMAAVAHVLRNRALDRNGKFSNSIAGVAKEPKQFSVWNDGKVAAADIQPGSPLYERAGKIYDAVMSGRTVDPTGGATHYYSPEGMRLMGKEKPDWFDSEAAKAGGAIKIGGHVFAGKAGASFSGKGQLEFRDPNQDKLQPTFRSALTDTSAALGMPLRILSGHRGEDHPVEQAKMFRGYGAGEHTKGNASDIDMTGMSEEQRIQLVRELRSRGVLRFGTYSNMPNVLHVDTKDQNKDGQSWFMHDKTNTKMESAPAWFKQAAAEPPGQIPAQPAYSGTEVQNLIRGYSGLNGPEKARAVADAMRRGLDAGDDSLFRDAGGVAILHELKAQPSDIDEVLRAEKNFNQKRLSGFSASRETWRNDFLGRVERGELNATAALEEIEKQFNAKLLDDTTARSLAHQATDRIRQREGAGANSQLGNPDFLNEIGGLYQKLQVGADFVTTAREAQEIAKKYGATENDVKSIVGQMFSIDQSYKTNTRKEAERIAATREKRDADIAQVERARAQKYGLSGLSGSIEIANSKGEKQNMTLQEYGVMRIKEEHAKTYSDLVSAGKMAPGDAKAEIIKKTMLELQNHGVVDKETHGQLVGALKGNILSKDGKLTEGARQAYDAYLIMRNTPNLKDGYIARTIGDEDVRALLETAYSLDAGDLNRDQALLKAHELMSTRITDPQERLSKDITWRLDMKKNVNETLTNKVKLGFFDGLLYDDSAWDIEQITRHTRRAEAYVMQRAEHYHMQYPNQDAKVSLEKATQDLQNNSTAVAGNLIITKPGYELHKVMGVTQHGPQAADEAVKMFLEEHGAKLWSNGLYDSKREGFLPSSPLAFSGKFPFVKRVDMEPGSIVRGMSTATGSLIRPVGRRDPGVAITYNPDMGVISIDLYKDETKQETLGDVKHIPVRAIGEWYNKQKEQPGIINKTMDAFFEALVSPIAKSKSEAIAKERGAEIGKMLGELSK